MAGRGRRLGGYGEKDGPLRRPGEAAVSPTTGNINITVLTLKISELEIFNIDPIILDETEILFKQLFVSGNAVKDILSSLHTQALDDSEFGKKLVIALEQVSTLQVDGVCVRSEWLTFVQNDYELKEKIFQSDNRKLANAVTLLGSIYNVFKIKGEPIAVLGCALIDYLDLLAKSDEETIYQVLATQLIENGNQIMTLENVAKRFDSLKHNLRKTLISMNFSSRGKCWILLSLDYISNNLRPLHGVIREFYIDNLGSDYLILEENSKKTTPARGSDALPKSQVLRSLKSETETAKLNKGEEIFQDIENLNISNPRNRGMRSVTKSNKPEQEIFTPRSKRYEENKMRQRKQGSEIKISTGRSKSPKSDDVLYGIQVEKKEVPDNEGEN